MPVDYHLYAPNWNQIRARILKRATPWNVPLCEKCGVPHHAVGYRTADGAFVRNRGNLHCDASGDGYDYDTGEPLTYAAARSFCDHYNKSRSETRPGSGRYTKRQSDDDGNHWFVVVLTVAHIDHDVANNNESNLRAWCQRCHLCHDAKHHAANAARTIHAKNLTRQAKQAAKQSKMNQETEVAGTGQITANSPLTLPI